MAKAPIPATTVMPSKKLLPVMRCHILVESLMVSFPPLPVFRQATQRHFLILAVLYAFRNDVKDLVCNRKVDLSLSTIETVSFATVFDSKF